jgi:hypothetical protein
MVYGQLALMQEVHQLLQLVSRMVGVASLPQWLYLISWSNHFLLIDFVLIVSATKSVVELLTERVNQLSVKNDNDLVSQSLPALPLLLEIFNSTRVQDFLLDEFFTWS